MVQFSQNFRQVLKHDSKRCNFSRVGRSSRAQVVDLVYTREHEGAERDTEGVGCDMSQTLKLFLVSGSLFSGTSTRIITSISGF